MSKMGSEEEKIEYRNSLVDTRGRVRAKITRLCTKIEEGTQVVNNIVDNANLTRLISLKNEVEGLDKEIIQASIALNFSEEQLETLSIEEEGYEERIHLCLSLLNSKLNAPPQTENLQSENPTPEVTAVPPKLKLPNVPLPTFSNEKGEYITKFFKSFEAIVDKHNLSDYEKYLYLKNQLSKAPLKLVESLDVDKQSYVTAKTLLNEAFDATLTGKHEIIQLLSKLNLPKNGDPYSFIGDMRTVQSGIKSHAITMDDVVQYFVWNGLNNSFQTHLTQITNKSQPSLKEIEENIFEATTRYSKQIEKIQENKFNFSKPEKSDSQKYHKPISSNALNVQSKNQFCGLCKKDGTKYDHSMDSCAVYTSAKQKYDKLRKINGCTKCSFINHITSKCTFVFKSNCRHCSGLHMSYLCMKPKPTTNVKSVSIDDGEGESEEVVEVNNSVLCVEASHISSKSSTVLPTFTATLKGEQFDLPVRIFKDSGCQKTFICASIASTLNLPVVQTNFPLTIHGFNSSKTIKTNLVEIYLKVGEKYFSHNAICINSIRTEFEIDGLNSVVTKFVGNGYVIADKDYQESESKVVDNIDLVLGTDLDHVLPMSYKLFGNPANPDSMSSYIETPIGVMFSGDVSKMQANLPHLKACNDSSYSALSLPAVASCNPCSSSLGGGNDQDIVDVIGSQDRKDKLMEESTVAASTEEVNELPLEYSNDKTIKSLTEIELDAKFNKLVDMYDNVESEGEETETNQKLVDFVLNNTTRDSEGRLVMPITWNAKNCHLLAQNYNLAVKVLESNLKVLQKDDIKLKMYNQVIKDQEELGVIERIDDIQQFLDEHPEASFLAHSAVFRMSHDSTKCRIVFLSNLCEKFNNGISHNMAMLPGSNLNHKILTSLLLNRFDKYLLIFDIKKAFLNIKLFECDQNRLCFLWYRNVEKGDFSVIGLKNTRLSFGLRPSPFILMLGLYKMLILDETDDKRIEDIKRKIYNSVYMDNCSYSCGTETDLMEAYESLDSIFSPYKMGLQQFYTNSEQLQNQLEDDLDQSAPEEVKLLGTVWNVKNDTLSPVKINLNKDASTKRSILASLNSIYDLLNVYAPILLRAKLFMQRLQNDPKFKKWDVILSAELLREWQAIVKQANSSPPILIPRFIGSQSDKYELIAFTDASKDAFGVVLYLKDLGTSNISYFFAKNRLISKAAAKRSMPSLEFNGIAFGVEMAQEVMESLCSDSVLIPIKIEKITLFTDSMVGLHWLRSHNILFDKQKNISVFVKNKMRKIDEICRNIPITFRHVSGESNPADFLTRPTSSKVLSKTNFYSGPEFIRGNFGDEPSDLVVSLPNTDCRLADEVLPGVGLTLAQRRTPINAQQLSTGGSRGGGHGAMAPPKRDMGGARVSFGPPQKADTIHIFSLALKIII